jgi:hypothetical protein
MLNKLFGVLSVPRAIASVCWPKAPLAYVWSELLTRAAFDRDSAS